MSTDENRNFVSAWGISLVVHGVAVAVAFAFAAQVKPVLQEELFRWDVALVENVKADSSREQARPVADPAKPPARVTPPQPSKVMPETFQSVQEIVGRQEIKKEEVKEPEPTVREVATETPAIVEPVTTAQPYAAPAQAAAQSAPEQRPEPVTTASAASPVVTESTPTVSADHVESTGAPPAPTAREQTPRVTTKADYAWLADSLGRRIAALTRYPSAARLNGWEGRVVLRAIIRADGHLLDVKVHKSSGHDALDHAALETIKLACPLHMKHALDSTEVAIYVPIVYSLSG